MLRFTIRDLMWITVVVALVLALFHQRREFHWRLEIAQRHASAVRTEVLKAQSNEQEYASMVDPSAVAIHQCHLPNRPL